MIIHSTIIIKVQYIKETKRKCNWGEYCCDYTIKYSEQSRPQSSEDHISMQYENWLDRIIKKWEQLKTWCLNFIWYKLSKKKNLNTCSKQFAVFITYQISRNYLQHNKKEGQKAPLALWCYVQLSKCSCSSIYYSLEVRISIKISLDVSKYIY